MTFVERTMIQTFRMRKSPSYPGDYVEHHELLIGGKRFESSRVFWGNGDVTVSITPYGKTNRLHEWHGRPPRLACGHVKSYGCDCDTIAAEAPEPAHTCGPGIQWGCDVPDCDGDNGD